MNPRVLFPNLLASAAFLLVPAAGDSVFSTLKAAPAPKKKPPPARPCISYFAVMAWNKTRAPVRFEKDGKYWCHWQGEEWHGSWTLKGDVLSITEARNAFDPQPDWMVWKITLVPGKWKSAEKTWPGFELFYLTQKEFD